MLQRIRFLAKNYNTLRGLALVGNGAALLIWAIWNGWLFPHFFPKGVDKGDALAGVLVLLALLATTCFYLPQVYYRRIFGQTNTPVPGEVTRVNVSGWMLLCFALIIVGMTLDVHVPTHVSFLVLAAAATLVVRWHCLGRTLHYYLVLAAMTIGLSFLPFLPSVNQVFGQSAGDQYSGLLDAIVGGLLIAVGLCDHVVLIRNVRKIRSLMKAEAEGVANL